MTVTDQIKILNRKIKQNESQYDLDREAAKISALSSNNLDKYELLTGEDLNLKPSTVEQAKFEYSPLDKIFNKGLSQDNKKEGLLKKLKNIEDKNKEQLKAIEDQGEKQLEQLKNLDKTKMLKIIDKISKKHDKANKLLLEVKKMDKTLENSDLVCTKTDGTPYNFNNFSLPLKFIEKIHNYEITLDEAINSQTKLNILINKLNNDYNPRNLNRIDEKQSFKISKKIAKYKRRFY